MTIRRYKFGISLLLILLFMSKIWSASDEESPATVKTGSGIYRGGPKRNGYFPGTLRKEFQKQAILFLCSDKGSVYALDVKDGKELWKVRTNIPRGVFTSPVPSNGKIILTIKENSWKPRSRPDSGRLLVLNADNGREHWHKDIGVTSYSPAVLDGKIYVGTNGSGESYLSAFEIKAGKKLWSQSCERLLGAPCVKKNTIFFQTASGKNLSPASIETFQSKNGKSKWKIQLESKSGSSGSVLVWDNFLYFGSTDKHFYCLNSKNGKVVWKVATDRRIYSSPALDKGIVIIGSQDDFVYAVDAKTGKQVWKFKTVYCVDRTPAIEKKYVYVVAASTLYALKVKTGEKVWESTTSKQITCSPAVAYGKIFVGDHSGKIYAIDCKTGKEIWTFKADGMIISPPAIAD